jgi:predicted HTH domain antitoxin
MRTLVLNIPDTVDFDDKEALMAIAARLYEKGKLSLGQAAELVGLSKRTFIEILSTYGVSVFNYPPSDLDRDAENAKSYNI